MSIETKVSLWEEKENKSNRFLNALKNIWTAYKQMVDDVLFLFKVEQTPQEDNFFDRECGRWDGLDLPMISVEEHDAMIARADEIRRTHRVFRD